MKVIEKGTDRTAYAHIQVGGRVQPLEEYGQYVDAHDGAICCYVAVEEGHQIKVDGRFSGVTLTVAHDFLVDGVCRKANSATAKSVQMQKNKKLNFDTFLYHTSDGPIDTEMVVSPRSGPAVLSKDASETVGTMELRVYITRQFGVEHEINEACMYDKFTGETDTGTQMAVYKDVPPQFHMTFEKNCSTLDKASGNREKKKMCAKRPGKEPWVTFRFHYRSKESILKKGMPLTFDAEDKTLAKADPHVLELEPTPELTPGSKPAGKNDGETSVRTSSPAPPDTPSTPTKSSKKGQIAQPKVVHKKQPTKSNPNTASTSKMAPITDTELTKVVDTPTDLVPDTSNSGDIQSSSAQATDNPSTTTTSKPIDNDKPVGSSPVASKNGDVAVVPKKSTKKATKKASASNSVLDADAESKEVVKEAVVKNDGKDDSELADVTPQIPTVEAINVPKVSAPAESSAVVDASKTPSTTATEPVTVPLTKDFVKNGAQRFVSPFKKGTAKPAPIDTTTSTVLQKPIIPRTLATPIKRAPEGTLTPPPDVKRIKIDGVPPLTPTHLLRPSSASPSPRSMSMEAEVAEQRKRLEAARKKRTEKAEQKAALDEKLAPYKQRMAVELERLRQEIADEEMMAAEYEEDCNTSKALLEEYMRADGDGY